MRAAALRHRRRSALLACQALALAGLALSVSVGAQPQSFSRGQNIAPAFEGWERNADGSFNLVFGYMNRNWDEEIDVPPGPENNIQPGGPDRGQPTHFLPRRNRFIFRVRVPKEFGTNEVVWTLTTNGVTEKAYGTLRPDYFIDDNVIQTNNGAGGMAGSNPELFTNKAPSLTIEGPKTRSVKAGEPVVLTAVATDDGVPKPRGLPPSTPQLPSRFTVDGATGLRLSWFVYRGKGDVGFDPPQIKVWEDTRDRVNSPWSSGWRTPPAPAGNKWVVKTTFTEPGTYVLRCLAHDGGLMTAEDITFTVNR